MPPASVVLGSDILVENLQNTQRISGTLTILPGTGYPVGGIPLDLAILGIPGVQTNSGIRTWRSNSLRGLGYIYERVTIPNVDRSGALMILQVPPAGSLTTAGPLQQLGSAANSLSSVQNDVISFECFVLRNA